MIQRRPREGTLVVQTAYLGNVVLTNPLLAVLADRHGPVDVAADDRAAARTWLAQRRVSGEFVTLAPGSVWAARRWPHHAALAAALDRAVVVIGGRHHRAGPGARHQRLRNASPRDRRAYADRRAVRTHDAVVELDVAAVTGALASILQSGDTRRAVRARH